MPAAAGVTPDIELALATTPTKTLSPTASVSAPGTPVTAQLGGTLQNAWLAGYLPPHRGRPAVAFAIVVFDTELNAAAACAPALSDFLRGFYGEGGS